MASTKDKIIEIVHDIDNLSFPPKDDEEKAKWERLLEDLNFQLCELELQDKKFNGGYALREKNYSVEGCVNKG